jgi:hypothetical protein
MEAGDMIILVRYWAHGVVAQIAMALINIFTGGFLIWLTHFSLYLFTC